MKVVMVTPRYRTVRGGGEISCRLLVKTLHDLGVEIDVLSGELMFPEIKDTWKLNIAMYRYLKRITNEYDVFHTYNMSLLPAIGVITKKYNINSVATLNGHVFSPTFAKELSDHPVKEHLINSFLVKFAIRHIKRFTTLSEFYKETWAKDGISQEKIRVIPNMILKDYALTDKLIHPKGVNILAVGNYAKWRNIKMLLDAYSELPKQDIKLEIVGQGWWKEIANYHGENTVIYYPHVKNDALKRIYSLADIYVQSYKYNGVGRAMLEAGISKTAILTTGKYQDFPYLCGSIGYFNDKVTLKKALQILIGHKKLRNIMSEDATELITRHFNPKVIAKEYIELYEELL